MKFIDLSKQYTLIQNKIEYRIQQVLHHGQYIMGPEVYELEKQLTEYVGIQHCISCSSGTDALLMPLLAWGIGPGDAVFTSTFTFIATAEVISLLGATPVFIDIDKTTYNMDFHSLEDAVQKVFSAGKLKPTAVIPVDLFGLPSDYENIEAIARKYGLLVLGDTAQSFGGEINGRKCGGFGDASATSFFPTKPLGCYGDGGAIFTNDDDLATRIRSIRVHGKGTTKYDNIRIGINGRLDTIQAAILLEKLALFPEELSQRQQVADWYTQALSHKVNCQVVPEKYKSSWAQYTIVTGSTQHREEICSSLKENDIPTTIYYPRPLHLQPVFENLGYSEGSFPNAEMISKRILSLPMHPYLLEEEIYRIAEYF